MEKRIRGGRVGGTEVGFAIDEAIADPLDGRVGVAAGARRRERNEERIILFRVVKLFRGLISKKMEGFVRKLYVVAH